MRAPFDGVVSDRKVSAGDTAAIGKELLKVIDPTSMRFEGLVSADRMGDVHAGQAVQFRINGFDKQRLHGKVRHVDAVGRPGHAPGRGASSTSRRARRPSVAGLYAEGRIATGRAQALLLPEAAVVARGRQGLRVARGRRHARQDAGDARASATRAWATS